MIQLPNNPVDTRINILEKIGECGNAIHRALVSYQSLHDDLASVLQVLARELEKFYDKKCAYREYINLIAANLRQQGDRTKEKATKLREVTGITKNVDAPFMMMKIITEAFLDDRDTYIHYSSKLEELQAEKIKKENGGTKASKKEIERLTRNEGKLEEATASYAVSLKKFKIESENVMEKRLRIMNPAISELYKIMLDTVQEDANNFQDIEGFEQAFQDYIGIEEYKAHILPSLTEKMGEVSKFEGQANLDSRFSGLSVSNIAADQTASVVGKQSQPAHHSTQINERAHPVAHVQPTHVPHVQPQAVQVKPKNPTLERVNIHGTEAEYRSNLSNSSHSNTHSPGKIPPQQAGFNGGHVDRHHQPIPNNHHQHPPVHHNQFQHNDLSLHPQPNYTQSEIQDQNSSNHAHRGSLGNQHHVQNEMGFDSYIPNQRNSLQHPTVEQTRQAGGSQRVVEPINVTVAPAKISQFNSNVPMGDDFDLLGGGQFGSNTFQTNTGAHNPHINQPTLHPGHQEQHSHFSSKHSSMHPSPSKSQSHPESGANEQFNFAPNQTNTAQPGHDQQQPHHKPQTHNNPSEYQHADNAFDGFQNSYSKNQEPEQQPVIQKVEPPRQTIQQLPAQKPAHPVQSEVAVPQNKLKQVDQNVDTFGGFNFNFGGNLTTNPTNQFSSNMDFFGGSTQPAQDNADTFNFAPATRSQAPKKTVNVQFDDFFGGGGQQGHQQAQTVQQNSEGFGFDFGNSESAQPQQKNTTKDIHGGATTDVDFNFGGTQVAHNQELEFNFGGKSQKQTNVQDQNNQQGFLQAPQAPAPRKSLGNSVGSGAGADKYSAFDDLMGQGSSIISNSPQMEHSPPLGNQAGMNYASNHQNDQAAHPANSQTMTNQPPIPPKVAPTGNFDALDGLA